MWGLTGVGRWRFTAGPGTHPHAATAGGKVKQERRLVLLLAAPATTPAATATTPARDATEASIEGTRRWHAFAAGDFLTTGAG